MAPPTSATTQQRIEQSFRTNVAAQQRKAIDRTYQNEIKKYKKFIDSERACGHLANGPTYITRENVDLYFGEVVANKKVKACTARRVVNALQALADYFEHVPPADKFNIESPHVLAALEHQKQNSANRGAATPRPGSDATKKLPDPHDNVRTNMMTMADRKNALTVIHLTRASDWGSQALTWTYGHSMFLRGHSCRCLELRDFICDETHGPDQLGNNNQHDPRTLAIILRTGEIHKDRYIIKKTVGCWRHKEWLLCSTGMTAMHLLYKLTLLGDSIDFFWIDQVNAYAKWHLIPVVDYSNYAQQYEATTVVIQSAGLDPNKVTHHRTKGMEYGGSNGLSGAELTTMSKHCIDKWTKYAPEINKETCKVMAGFGKTEGYYVPRAYLELPMPIDDLVLLLFPHINQWKYQHKESEWINKTARRSGNNFLFVLLPFLTKVAVQDGIYWIERFPLHQVSLLLKQKIPGYEAWARFARQTVENNTRSYLGDQTRALNDATHAAFASLAVKLDVIGERQEQRSRDQKLLLQKLQATEEKLARTEEKLTLCFREIQWLKNFHTNNQQPPDLQVANNNQAFAQPWNPRGPPAAGETPLQRAQQEQQTRQRSRSRQGQQQQVGDRNNNHPPRQHVRTQTAGDALSRLSANPRQPALPKELPKTIALLLQEHINLKLGDFEKAPKKTWAKNIRQAYSRRMAYYNYIVERAEMMTPLIALQGPILMTDLKRAAVNMDVERGDISVSAYLEWLKKNDGKVKSRKKRTRED